MGSGGTTALLPPDKFFSNLPNFNLKSGADTQSRTGDLTLTKGALYQLSHISTLNLMPGSMQPQKGNPFLFWVKEVMYFF